VRTTFVVGACFICRVPFGFNPEKVPITDLTTGERLLVCKVCLNFINEKRKERGDKPFTHAPDAYFDDCFDPTGYVRMQGTDTVH